MEQKKIYLVFARYLPTYLPTYLLPKDLSTYEYNESTKWQLGILETLRSKLSSSLVS